jgi:hypothetical protein
MRREKSNVIFLLFKEVEYGANDWSDELKSVQN